MKIEVAFTKDPQWVLRTAGKFLASQPVLHNMILTLLHARVKQREAGRYWVATCEDEAVGVVLQSPLALAAHLTPMEPRVASALVDAIADAGVSLPGVNGDAATAASFAGHWAERTRSAAMPSQGYRLYELLEIGAPPTIGGKLRQAAPEDRRLMIQWTQAFQAEIGEPEPENQTEVRVDWGLAAGEFWLWDNGEAVSMAVNRPAVESVVRISGVYTPVGQRKRGYAAACAHALSKRLSESGYRCILYTDLGNPTSNSIYRRIGYRAVAESLRYRFA